MNLNQPPQMQRNNRKALLSMWMAIVLIAGSWLFPPWLHLPLPESEYKLVSHPWTWAFLFDNWQGENYRAQVVFKIDYERLVLVDGIIALIGAGLFVTFTRKHEPK